MPLKPGQQETIPTKMPGDISGILANSPELQAVKDDLEAQIAKTKQELSTADSWNQSWVKSRLKREQDNLKSFETGAANIGALLPKLRKECSEALEAFKTSGKLLYRGVRADDNGESPLAFLGMPRDDRRASDTSQKVHELLTKMFTTSGLKANRANSIFCSANRSQATGYGDAVYIIIPKNGFDFSWSPKYRDFYSDFIEDIGNSLGDFKRKFEKGAGGEKEVQVYNNTGMEIHEVLSKMIDRADDVYYAEDQPAELQDIARKVTSISYDMQRWTYGTQLKMSNLPKFQAAMKEFFEMVNALNTAPNIRAKFISDEEMRDLGEGFRFILDQVEKFNAEEAAQVKKLPQGENEKIINFIRVQNQFTDKDFVAALKSNHEICIRGEYYALKVNAFEEIFKGLFDTKGEE